jgi:hypothetical protein
MTIEQTKRTMDGYFEALGGEEFADCFADDVTWTTMDTGSVVRGRVPVRDFIIALHERMSGGGSQECVASKRQAFLEGDCYDAQATTERLLSFCLVYDLDGQVITAMRLYGSLATLLP